MVSYYNIVEGNLRTGDTAKSSDINHIQVHIQDMAKEMNLDFHDGESYILGSGEKHKNDFILTAAPKLLGRYIDDRMLFEVDPNNFIPINRNDVKQPILLTKSSVYSVITKLKNSSNKDIPVNFELQDINGNVLRSNSVTIPAGTTEPREFEIIFDLEHYPTSLNIDHEMIEERDGKDICFVTKEEDYDEGFQHNHEDEEELEQFSVGISQLFFVIKRTNLNEIDLVDAGEEPVFNPETDLGVFYTGESISPEKNIFCSVNSGKTFEVTDKNIWFKEVYANEQTYLCTGGEAIIGGEKVHCVDTHISVESGNSYGHVLSNIYLGLDGHLYFRNSKASLSTDINDFEEDLASPMPAFFLPIAAILTYSNVLGVDKEPLILQSQEDGQRPLSHHERLRRLENLADWTKEYSMTSRLKWTLTEDDIINENGSALIDLGNDWFTSNGMKPISSDDPNADLTKDPENIKNYYTTTDSEGNPVIKLSDSKVETISVTLKEKLKDKDGKAISLKENDILNASYFASLSNMVRDEKKGTLMIDKENVKNNEIAVGTTAKEAKLTEYNPWDDYKGNRPASSKLKKHEREFEVVSGKNGRNDFESQFPAMTLYTNTNYKLKKLNIPIFKFKNCSGIKFYIWKRQNPNNKKNTVWLEKKIYTSKEFSLKKAKVRGKYQYMEEGFTISFGKKGLSLPKGQYVIIALPIPKSGEGSVFVETYKPQNPKDFLIRYHGAANASHFLLKKKYAEIWYNKAVATVEEEDYHKKGVAVSKTITWDGTGLQRIQTVNPVIGKHIKIPKKCSYKIFADTGAGWQQLTPNQDNTMTGGATTFKWKIEFYSNGKDSPVLSYNSKDKYAIKFILTRAKSGTNNIKAIEDLDKSMCLTSNTFDADDIIREYTGDNNLATLSNPFSQYEFARIWAENVTNKKLLIDIQGSDRYIGDTKAPLWSYHYCDLTLDDFSKQNVDYSNYEEDVEYDENNLRLKLDSNHSYNDEDIIISKLKEFKKVPNSIDSSDSDTMNFVNNDNVTTNQLFLKSTFDDYYDLTKYTGLRFTFKTSTINNIDESGSSLKGLGIYISSNKDLEEVPTNATSITNVEKLTDTDVLPPTIDPTESSASYYDGRIIELSHNIDVDGDGNKAYEVGYYQYVPEYSQEDNRIIYKLQQIHDVKTYKIYNIGEINFNSSNIKEETVEVPVLDDDNNPVYEDVLDSEGNPVYTNVITKDGKLVYANGKDENGNDIYYPAEAEDGTPLYETIDNVKKVKLQKQKMEEKVIKRGEYTARIELDPDSQNLKYAREIGIITLNDEGDAYNVNSSGGISLELSEVRGISQDYYPIFNPKKDVGLFKAPELNKNNVIIKDYDKLLFDNTTFDDRLDPKLQDSTTKAITELRTLEPHVTQISIKFKDINVAAENKICYMNNEYGKLSHYKHLGVQIASDVYIPKDCLKINLCEEINGEGVFETLNIPTVNTIYNPNAGGSVVKYINLSQIFKKINTDKEIKSISITATEHFVKFMTDIISNDKGNHMNLFIGKIVLYRAETIPMFHKIMRYKLYSATDGNIDHATADVIKDSISIRKIGTIIDYS